MSAKSLAQDLDAIEKSAHHAVHTSGYLTQNNTGEDMEFAANYYEEQEREKRHRAYLDYVPMFADQVKASGGGAVQTVVSPNEADIDIYMQKEEEAQLARYENWIQSRYLKLEKGEDPDLAAQKLVRDLVPEYYERRLAQIDRNLEIQRKAARIKLFGGPRTAEELKFMYMLETKQIALPTNLAFETGKAALEKSGQPLHRGIFNIRRYYTDEPAAKGWFGQDGWDDNKGTEITSKAMTTTRSKAGYGRLIGGSNQTIPGSAGNPLSLL